MIFYVIIKDDFYERKILMNNFKESLKLTNYEPSPLSEREARRTYEKFVIEQEEPFILFINYFNKYINNLRDQGKITPHLAFYARVKAANSAYQNHSNGKSLDDAFGIEILATSESEYRILMKAIESSEESTISQSSAAPESSSKEEITSISTSDIDVSSSEYVNGSDSSVSSLQESDESDAFSSFFNGIFKGEYAIFIYLIIVLIAVICVIYGIYRCCWSRRRYNDPSITESMLGSVENDFTLDSI